MKNILLVRIPPPVSRITPGTIVQWGVFSNHGEIVGDVHISEIQELRADWLSVLSKSSESFNEESEDEECFPNQVVVLVSGMLAVYKQLPIISAQKKHLSTALPYMIEEAIAEDVDKLHLASNLDNKESRVSISAMPHEQMQILLESLDKQGISAHYVLAEQQFFTSESKSLLLLPESQSVMIAEPGKAAIALDYGALKLVLDHWNEKLESDDLVEVEVASEASTALANAKVIYAEGSFPTSSDTREQVTNWLNEQGWLVEEELLEGSVLEHLATGYFSALRDGKLVDLRHGVYKCSKTRGKLKRWRRPIVILLVLWGGLQSGLMIAEGVLLSNKAQNLWNESAELYLRAFPQDRQIKEALTNNGQRINIKSRMESRLKSIAKSSDSSGEQFLPLLQQVSAVIASVADAKIEPQNMDFSELSGKLVLDFKAETLEGVDKFVAAAKSSGLAARLDTASKGKVGVTARVTIGKGN